MTRRRVKVGDLGHVVTGDTPPKRKPEYYGSAYPFIKPTDMQIGCRYTYSFEECYSEEAFEKYKKKLIPPGATAVVTIGSIGQKLTLTHTACFVNQAVNAVIPNTSRFDNLYVYYLLRHNLHLVKSADTGASSGRENVSKSNFSGLEVVAELDKDTQCRIATTLSAYDDLIENNQRRIKLLEEAARRLYREWFVALRYPGHERVKVVDGVPQGWERLALSQAIEINPRTRANDDEKHPFVPMQALSESSMVVTDYEMRTPTGAKFRNGDTLLARITPCLENGKTGFVQFLAGDDEMASGSTEFIVMRSPANGSPHWVYCLARDESFRDHAIRSMVGSDGRQRVNTKLFDQYLVLTPPEGVFAKFDRVVKPLFQQIHTLALQSNALKQARDALLPRLMSGALAV